MKRNEIEGIISRRRKALLPGDAKALRLYDSLSERMRISMVGEIFS